MRLRELVRRMGRSRGSAPVGITLVVALVAGGMTLGHGIASHAVSSGYSQAWLADSSRGQLVQVDPVAKRANLRLQLTKPGDPITIQQGNGTLVVVDRKTGTISTINLSTLLVGGTRTTTTPDHIKVLLAGGTMYIANLATGTIQAVDPATETNIGQPWNAGHPLVDVTVDGQQRLWALEGAGSGGGQLVNLAWSPTTKTLTTVSTDAVTGTGPGSVLVSHPQGVTVVGTQGTITQVGTGPGSGPATVNVPPVSGPLTAPPTTPTNLVAVSSPGAGTVVIFHGGDVTVVDTGALGCAHPGIPAVFAGAVYVPCSGAGQVLVLSQDGRQQGPPIQTPPGDPQLVIADGQLLVDVPGADVVTVIDGSGTVSQIPTVGPSIGVQQPTPPPPPPPPPPPTTPSTPPPTHHRGDSPDGNNGNGGGPGHGGPGNGNGHGHGTPTGTPSSTPSGTPSTTPTATPSATPTSTPTGTPGQDPHLTNCTATATARSDGSVLVSWSPAPSDATYVVAASTGATVAPPAGATQAIVNTLPAGTTASFTVTVTRGGATACAPTTGQVTTFTQPGAVGGVTVTADQPSGGQAVLHVSWNAAAANGKAVSYLVATSGATPAQTAGTSATLTVPCATSCTGTVTVTPQNAAGDGGVGQAGYQAGTSSGGGQPPVQQPPAMPVAGEAFVAKTGQTPGYDNGPNGGDQDATVTLTLTAPGDWAQWTGGSCYLYDNTVQVEQVGCNANGLVKQLNYVQGGKHTYTVRAIGANSSVDSNQVTTTVLYRITPCSNSASAGPLSFDSNLLLMPPCNPPCNNGGINRPICPLPNSVGATPLDGDEHQLAADRILLDLAW